MCEDVAIGESDDLTIFFLNTVQLLIKSFVFFFLKKERLKKENGIVEGGGWLLIEQTRCTRECTT